MQKPLEKDLLAIHEIFENGWLHICDIEPYQSITMAMSIPPFLMTRISQQQIHLHLIGIAKEDYVHAQDIVDVMSTPEMKRYLGTKAGINK